MLFGLFGKKNREVEEQIESEDVSADISTRLEEDKKLVEEMIDEPIVFKREKINIKDTKTRLDYLGRLHDAILEAKKQCEDVKFEYGQVTSFLKDIQLIEQAPDEEKVELLGAAFNIVDLTNERMKLQKQTYKMTDAQKRALENEEMNVDGDIEKLLGYEDYHRKIKEDLRKLKSEKNYLTADKKDIIKRQKTLKGIGKALSIILASFGIMLIVLFMCFKVDITVPFVATAAFAFVVATIILNEARKNRIDMVITDKKSNKAILLSNRVKIKYFNNVRTLDYMYHKYRVNSATELDFVYSQYRKAKREWAKQRESTKLINEYNKVLISELKRLGVKDCDVWLSQTAALVKPSEMVEVRHELNVSRQKLREQMDYNTGIVEQCLEQMEKISDENPEYAKEIELLLKRRMTSA